MAGSVSRRLRRGRGASTEALEVLGAGDAAAWCTFGYSDDEAFAVGLTCGGTIHLFIEAARLVSRCDLRASCAAASQPSSRWRWPPDRRSRRAPGAGRASCWSRPGGAARAPWATPTSTASSARDADRRARRRADRHPPLRPARRGPPDRGRASSSSRFAPPPRMVIFGAVDFTAALVRVAKVLGYRVTVCDARAVFATKRALPDGRRGRRRLAPPLLARSAPPLGPRDAVCVLTHDHKFDVPAIVGALGDRRRLPRGHGVAAHPRRAHRAAARGGRRRRRAGPAARRPSASTSGPARRRRRRSSICAEIIALRGRPSGRGAAQGNRRSHPLRGTQAGRNGPVTMARRNLGWRLPVIAPTVVGSAPTTNVNCSTGWIVRPARRTVFFTR